MTPLILSYCYQERVTATSVGQMFDDLGGAVSYLIAVLMTPHEPAGFPNTTGKVIYTVKRVIHFPFPAGMLLYQTLPGRE